MNGVGRKRLERKRVGPVPGRRFARTVMSGMLAVCSLGAGGVVHGWAPGSVPGSASGLESGSAHSLHTQLEESRPADGDVLVVSPDEIWLRFSTTIQVNLSAVELRAGGAQFAVLTAAYVEGAEQMQIRAALRSPLPPGEYTVAWQTAGPDSHLINGTFSFVVEADLQAAAAQAQAAGPDTDATEAASAAEHDAAEPGGEVAQALAPIGLFSRWSYFLAIVLMLGMSAFRLGVVSTGQRRGEAELVADMLPRLRLFGFIAGGLAIFAALARLFEQARALAAAGTSALGLGAFLFASPWGVGWWIFVASALLFLLGMRLVGKSGLSSGGWRLATIAALFAAVTPAMGGHAWGFESARPLAVGVDILHVIGGGAWLGGLAALVFVAIPVLGRHKDAEGRVAALSPWVDAFSRVALPAVALIVLTGGISAYLHLGGVGPLFSTPYGRGLLAKLAVLAGAFAIGFYNWRSIRPALAESGKPGLLRGPATVELILGVCVLLATSVLVMLHPPL